MQININDIKKDYSFSRLTISPNVATLTHNNIVVESSYYTIEYQIPYDSEWESFLKDANKHLGYKIDEIKNERVLSIHTGASAVAYLGFWFHEWKEGGKDRLKKYGF